MTNYTIKRTLGNQAFEISGPDKEWVEAQAETLAAQFKAEDSELNGKQKITNRRSSTTSKPNRTNTKVADAEGSQLMQKLNNSALGSLVDYVAERQQAFDKQIPNQAAIIAKFLKDKLIVDQISKEDLAHIYTQVGAWNTVNHKAQLDNATDRKKYFVRKDGKFELTYAGEKFAQDTARNTDKG